jgi:hypothetical protein
MSCGTKMALLQLFTEGLRQNTQQQPWRLLLRLLLLLLH